MFPGGEVSWKTRFAFARRPAGFCACKGSGKYQSCYGSNRDLESSNNPTPAPAAEPDLLQERAVLFDFLAKTIDSDDSEDNEVDCVCSN